ncbi:hypothetical protein BVRB_3g063190 [Beta vulgaris subsp. vulgaris]|nr:hypothetical protein BVRB_3g063190 [Beta vulgaris subsp. vulgaris]
MENHLLPNNGALGCVLGVSPWRHFAKELLGEIPFGLMERWLSNVWDPLFINWLAKFPEYKNRDLFVTGESYGGHYVPQLANLILKSSLKTNLKGVADVQKIDVCIDDEATIYLNRKDVQKAMNAHLVGVTQWAVCNDVLNYRKDDVEIPTLPLLGTFVKSGVRVLVYSGDQDSAIPLTGSRRMVDGLAKELGLKTTVSYRTWLSDKQVGGWTQVYGDILAFATIRGAAHEAPYSQPARSLVLFRSFLNGYTSRCDVDCSMIS